MLGRIVRCIPVPRQGATSQRPPATLLYDMLGLEISEGALVNMLEASRDAFAKQIGARPSASSSSR
jgi:hypothetical protein